MLAVTGSDVPMLAALILTVLPLTVLMTSCGGATDRVAGTDPTTTAERPTTPGGTEGREDQPVLPVTVTDTTGAEVTVESAERIIPLDGTVAEVVFALDLGDRVVATDLSATYPPEADALPEIGYQRALAAEPIATFQPTVLLATDLAGPPETLDELRALGYPVVIVPNESSPDGPGDKIRAVADALGVPERGRILADEVDRSIAEASGSAPRPEVERPLVAALYVRGGSAQLVLGRTSATHWLIVAAGGRDVADQLDIDDNAPISAEALVEAGPDLLLVPTTGLESVGGVDGLLEIPGLARTPAGENRAVLAFDDQLLLGNGPRAGQLLADLRDELAAAAPS